MALAFILGLAAAAIGVLVSLTVKNWQVGFILCGTLSLISIILASMLRNHSLIMKKAMKDRGSLENKSLENVEKWSKAITLFATPSIVTAAILYFKLYR